MDAIKRMPEGKEKEAAKNIVKCLRDLSYSEAMLVLDIVGKSLGNYATINFLTGNEDSPNTP